MSRTPRITKKELTHMRRPRLGMDRAHLEKIRQCPCVICGARDAEAHHLLRSGERGLSLKSPDRFAIALCPRCHRTLHDKGDEEAYLTSRGIDGRALAGALWAVRGEKIEAYRRVVFNARQRASLAMRVTMKDTLK